MADGTAGKSGKSASLRLPQCVSCGAHIGWHAPASMCGACRNPSPLTRRDMRQMRKLTISHWGNGSIRSLVQAQGGYRPALVVKKDDLALFCAASVEMCRQRAELADYYDRMQASRNDPRRACRV